MEVAGGQLGPAVMVIVDDERSHRHRAGAREPGVAPRKSTQLA